MLELKTRKINSILELKIDDYIYSVDLADQTPFLELGEIAQELNNLGLPGGDSEAAKEYMNKCADIRNRIADLLIKVLGNEEAVERLIGEGINMFKLADAIELISQIYMSEEAQELFEEMAGTKLTTLDKAGMEESEIEKFEALMRVYEMKKAE